LIRRIAASLLPGLFMVGYVIGTGSVTTMSTAGAAYGVTLVWTLLLASVFTHIAFVSIGQATILSGETILRNFRTHFGAAVTIALIAGVSLTQIASVIGVCGVLSDVVREWSRVTLGTEIPPLATAIASTGFLLALFLTGRHSLFLNVLSALVGLMGIAFLATAVAVDVSLAEVLAGLRPVLPSVGDPNLLVAGMVGTTMASNVLLSRSIVVHEKGWRPADLPVATRDSAVAAVLLFIINVAIMACAAGTLHRSGLRIERAIDMVRTLEPIAGSATTTVFVIGIIAAGLSSLFPNYIIGAWMLTDFRGQSRSELTRPAYRVLVILTALTGLYVPLFGGNPVQIMIASQAISPVIMPILMTLVLVLLRKHNRSPILTISLMVTVAFTLYVAVVAVRGFAGL
jgi:Mn2+/Fe2+ NRAMP family transporter